MKRTFEQATNLLPPKRRKPNPSLLAFSDEILLLILSFLDVGSLVTAQAVSSRFKLLGRDNLLWQKRYRMDFSSPRRLKPVTPARLSRRKALGTINPMDDIVEEIDWLKRYRVRFNWSTGRCLSTYKPPSPRPPPPQSQVKNSRSDQIYDSASGFRICLDKSSHIITVHDTLHQDRLVVLLRGYLSHDAVLQVRTHDGHAKGLEVLGTTVASIAFTAQGVLEANIQVQELVLCNKTRRLLHSRTASVPGPAIIRDTITHQDKSTTTRLKREVGGEETDALSRGILYQHPFLVLPTSSTGKTPQPRFSNGNTILLYLVTSTPASLSIVRSGRIVASESIARHQIGVCRAFGYVVTQTRDALDVWTLPHGTPLSTIVPSVSPSSLPQSSPSTISSSSSASSSASPSLSPTHTLYASTEQRGTSNADARTATNESLDAATDIRSAAEEGASREVLCVTCSTIETRVPWTITGSSSSSNISSSGSSEYVDNTRVDDVHLRDVYVGGSSMMDGDARCGTIIYDFAH